VELQLAGGGSAIDAFAETDERDADRLELLEQRHQMLQIPAEPIETPAHQDVEAPPARVSHEAIAPRPSVLPPGHPPRAVFSLRPGHPTVDVFSSRPSTGLDVFPQFKQLVVRRLVHGGDPGINGCSHWSLRGWSVRIATTHRVMASRRPDASCVTSVANWFKLA